VSEFFGLDMTYIMIALLCVLVVALSTVAYVFLGNRVIFNVGVRNIPRRRAQTILIIIGLMLSTVIISAALSIGDTVDYSITNTAYRELHSVDELVSTRTEEQQRPGTGDEGEEEEDEADPFEAVSSIVSPLPIPEDRANSFIDRFRQIEGVDGALKVIRGASAAVNETKGQSEQFVVIVGVPSDELEGFEQNIEREDGGPVRPDELSENEILASESAADDLDIDAGDRLTFYVAGAPHEFTVKDVVKDRLLTGVIPSVATGFLLEFERAQELFGREDEVDFIAVSNDGGVRDSIELSDSVTRELNEVLAGTSWNAVSSKENFVDAASEAASFLTTFFVVLGLFSIAAGVLLIFLIFVMLAAERKVEMGMVRAVGTKRRHLVQMFMSEGMVYNVASAAVGCGLGIVVSLVMVGIMARLFADFGLQITFHVTARSLIIAYSIGVVLTFLTVTFSSYRIGNLNIVSAIRDTADPVKQEARPSSVLGYLRWLILKPSSWKAFFLAIGAIVLGAICIVLTVVMFIAAGSVYGDSTVAGTASVLLGIIGGAFAVLGAGLLLWGFTSIFQLGVLAAVVGPVLMYFGYVTWESAFAFGAGLSMLIIGGALTLRYIGLPARPVFTAMGLVMLAFWLLFAGDNVPGMKQLDGDIEMFFLSGVTMVIAGTFVLVYNADLILGLLTLTGNFFSSLVPSIKTAVAYPLANKFRTGMTIAMISLVMFALVMFTTMNANFDRIFLSDDALGGYDVIVTENPGNPLDDLTAALGERDFPTASIEGVDSMAVANRLVSKAAQLNVEEPSAEGTSIYGLSPDFVENNGLTFQAIANGFSSEAEVWEEFARNPNVAIVDAFKLEGGFGDGSFQLLGVENTAQTFDRVPVEISNSATGARQEVEVIGVLSVPASGLFGGVFIGGETFDQVFTRPDSTIHYVRLNEGVDANDTALDIERTLLTTGVQAESLRKVVDEYQAQSEGFIYLLQGFMAIGLFVGIAAVGVIAFRTVVERRQQIGMLRAIGYTRGAVALSFLMESSFTALLGILSGITLGLLLANQLVQTDEFVAGGVDGFYVPWLQITLVAGFAFLASLIMTIIPSRQASGIPIAEALRYE
jgi:putative ABC transport system permease protein